MSPTLFHKVLTAMIAIVWLVNGLFCKVLNAVPRHQEIVGSILGGDYAELLTKAIGVSEIIMALWILSGINAILQITIIATMNILEFILVPEWLLWGRFNILFATLLLLIIHYNEFILKRKLTR